MADLNGIDKILSTMSSKEIRRVLVSTLWARFTNSIKTTIKNILDEIIHKPFGRVYLVYHGLKNKLFEFMYNKGWVKEPQDTLEHEFDRKTNLCWKQVLAELKEIATKRESGNTCFWAVQDGEAIFTAVGAHSYKDWLNKHEFQLDRFPYANGFVGGASVPTSWKQSQMAQFDKEFTDLFLKTMDIDVRYTTNNNKTFYSRTLVNLADFFKVTMFANAEMAFFISRFLPALMRLVYLEQRKLDVSTDRIVELKRKWEQDLVHEFTLGVFLIGLTKYAFVFKCLPLNIQKRVPNFHARHSYEKADKYKAPTFLYQNRKH